MSDQVKETATARASRLMQEVADAGKASYSKGDVKSILNRVAMAGDGKDGSEGCRAPACLDEVRRGDVFIAKAVGGKVRPWVVLRVDDETVTAISMSSGDSAPNMSRSQCRFWPASWIGSTIAQFSMERAIAEVTRPYTAYAHLKEVEVQAYERMGATLHHVRSIAEIRSRISGA